MVGWWLRAMAPAQAIALDTIPDLGWLEYSEDANALLEYFEYTRLKCLLLSGWNILKMPMRCLLLEYSEYTKV
ncbi:hypothetical protein Tco_1442248, partial [Tanacetum coccineum]